MVVTGKNDVTVNSVDKRANHINTINNELMNLNRTGQEVEKVSLAVNTSWFVTCDQSNEGFTQRSFQEGEKVMEDGKLSG